MLRLHDVTGIYAEDTAAPSMGIKDLKIVTRQDIQFIEGVEEGQEPPSIGGKNKGNFRLNLNKFEEDTETSILSALDGEDDWQDEEPKLTPDEANQQLLLRVIQEQMGQREQITKLLAPLWLAVIALGVLVGIIWK